MAKRKKLECLPQTDILQEDDSLVIIQDCEPKNLTAIGLTSSLSETFATNEELTAVSDDLTELASTVSSNYTELSNAIVTGDEEVTSLLNSTIAENVGVVNATIDELEEKHDSDISSINSTVQEWIEEIDDKTSQEELAEALNRLTVAENAITSLADVVANGGISGDTVGYHTQPTSTITALSGYYKGTSADALVTTDTLNQALSKLENQVEAIADNSGSLPVIKIGESTSPSDNTIYTSGKVKEDYVYKNGDTVPGRIIYTSGIQGGSTFTSGWTGTGASLYPSGSDWNLELDNLFVRGSMTVNEIDVNEIKAVGGDMLVTVADMTCSEVEDVDSGYKCYFDTEDGTKYNEFIVNDQAICQQFDGANVKRYWRAVTEVGDNYIVLSKDICESGSGVPESGDAIILLGHRTEGDTEYDATMEDRRNAIFISAKGDNSPSITFYSNIYDFDLTDKETVVIGKNSKFTGSITVVSESGDTYAMTIYRGAWNADTTYYYNDIVTYNGSAWIATTESVGQVPSEDSSYWSLYIAKGDAGQAGDDVAKWVEITGEQVFLYDSTDYSGTVTPTSISLLANVYGIDNPSYEWRDSDSNPRGYQEVLVVTPQMIDEKYENFSCYVTDSDTGSVYYDVTQVAKLCNGDTGEDGYTILLSNYSASVPFDSEGNILVDPTTISTYVYAYKGTSQLVVTGITAEVTEGTATVAIGNTNNYIYLTALESTQATIELTIELSDGMTTHKTWYINQSKDGADGEDGDAAVNIYLQADSLVFHYEEYATVPSPTSITLTMQTSVDGEDIVSYSWQYSIAGTEDWTSVPDADETSNTYTVIYNGSYFTSTGADEITFRCVMYTALGVYTDMTTINVVRDGDSAFHGILENQQIVVSSDSDGSVTDWSDAYSYTQLWMGGTQLDAADYTLAYTAITTSTATLSINQDTKLISVNTSSVADTYLTVQWQINFVYNSTVVDTCVLSLVKNVVGESGSSGSSCVMIYCATNSTPTRPTFTDLLSASGSTSGGYKWYPTPITSTSTLVWSSYGYYNPDLNDGAGGMETLPDGSAYYWTTPIITTGQDGTSISSVTMYYYKSKSQTSCTGGSWSTSVPTASDGYWIWTKLRINYTYADGSTSYSETSPVCTTGATGADGEAGEDGMDGAALTFFGNYSSSTYYYYTSSVRCVVYGSNGTYYMVADSKRGAGTFKGINPVSSSSSSSYWTAMSSFSNIATGLLFAEEATLGGWYFQKTYMRSENNLIAMAATESSSTPFLAVGNSTYPGFSTSTKLPSASALLTMYSSGIIRLGPGGTSSCMAGISGVTETTYSKGSVAFWAGGNNRDSAPFMVTHSGTVYATNAVIEGQVTATSGSFTGDVVCTSLTAKSIDIDTFNLPGVIRAIVQVTSSSCVTRYSSSGVSWSISASTGNWKITHSLGTIKYGVIPVLHNYVSTAAVSSDDVVVTIANCYTTYFTMYIRSVNNQSRVNPACPIWCFIVMYEIV